MSLRIDVDTVTRVLLADGWHDVVNGSFSLDSYEFLWSGMPGVRVKNMNDRRDPTFDRYRDPVVLLGGGQVEGVPSTGFDFETDDGRFLAGPITAVLAVEYKR